MDPSAMNPQLMQALMSDPELMRMIQRPEIMAKLQVRVSSGVRLSQVTS